MIKLKVFAILMCAVNLVNAQEDMGTTNKINNLYIIRFAGNDTANFMDFYGLSIAGIHDNKVAAFSGITLNFGLGNPPLQGKADNNISMNGINVSLFIASVLGTINGISFGGFWGTYAEEMNGIALGILGTGSESINGLAIGGLFSGSKKANAIQIGGIVNMYCNFNGIGIASINTNYNCDQTNINGLIFGIYNQLSMNGLSIGLVNNGNSWIQIGLVNIGDSTVQIGLVNLDENKKIGIPLINVNF